MQKKLNKLSIQRIDHSQRFGKCGCSTSPSMPPSTSSQLAGTSSKQYFKMVSFICVASFTSAARYYRISDFFGSPTNLSSFCYIKLPSVRLMQLWQRTASKLFTFACVASFTFVASFTMNFSDSRIRIISQSFCYMKFPSVCLIQLWQRTASKLFTFARVVSFTFVASFTMNFLENSDSRIRTISQQYPALPQQSLLVHACIVYAG